MANKIKYAYDEDGEPIFDADGERVVDSTVTSPSNGKEQQSSGKSIGQQIWSGLKQGYKNDRRIIGQPLAVSAAISSGIKSIFTGNNPVEAARNAYNREDSNAYEGTGITGTVADPINITTMAVPVTKGASLIKTTLANSGIQGLLGAGSEIGHQSMQDEDINAKKVALSGLMSAALGGTGSIIGSKLQAAAGKVSQHIKDKKAIDAAYAAEKAAVEKANSEAAAAAAEKTREAEAQFNLFGRNMGAKTLRESITPPTPLTPEFKPLPTKPSIAEPEIISSHLAERTLGSILGGTLGGPKGAILGYALGPVAIDKANAMARKAVQSESFVKGLSEIPRASSTTATSISDLIVTPRKRNY